MERKDKHTEGPWKMEVIDWRDDFPIAISSPLGATLAYVSHGGGSYHPDGRDGFVAETKANGSLIKQAPYMKTALEEIVAEYENGHHKYTAGVMFAIHALELIERADYDT